MKTPELSKKRQALFILLIIAVLSIAALIKSGALAKTDSNQTSAQTFVDLQETGQTMSGFRRAHAKGICIAGEFKASSELAKYSSAKVLQSGTYPFIGRFSIAGNNPTAPDLKAPVRSLAFAIDLGPTQQWRVAMNTPPVMAVGTPDAFFKQLSALAPDPVTKQRDPAKIKAFFDAHPETAAFVSWKDSYTPTTSFASEIYHGINAFYLTNAQGEKQAVRFRAIPQTPTSLIPNSVENSDDALQEQLAELLTMSSVTFALEFTLASDNDDETNPTVPWPQDRERLIAGELVIHSASDQNENRCGAMNFDPLVLPQGISATDDPILRARSSAYAESYRRRAKERLVNDVPNIVNDESNTGGQ